MTIDALLSQVQTHGSHTSIDTRSLSEGDLFFALSGTNTHGNKYVREALDKGASFVITDDMPEDLMPEDHHRVFIDKDPLGTLQHLAHLYRKTLKTCIISLTGSNGKTTTKELIHHVLQTRYNTISTSGNYNNHIGVPLTLLSIRPEHQYAVIEMGANHLEEIKHLCEIANPDYGLITNYGKAHIGEFGGFENIVKGKNEIYDFLIQQNGHIFYNVEDKIQKDKLASYEHKVGYSQHDETANLHYTPNRTDSPYASIQIDDTSIQSNLYGRYNDQNMAVASLIGRHFELSNDEIKRGIESYAPHNHRSQQVQTKDNTWIIDAYNANPSSMKAAIDNIAISEKKKILILGDMLELGEYTADEHQAVVDRIEKIQNLEAVYLLGEHFCHTRSTLTEVMRYQDFGKMKKDIESMEHKNCLILLKGSRSMELERMLK